VWCRRRFKDGRGHRYWSVAENVRVRGRGVVRRRHRLEREEPSAVIDALGNYRVTLN